jgi:large subunit ribosomal protein L31
MKDAIHPHYVETTVSCACGNVIETRATKENIKIEICSNCHPFYTGKAKLLDTEGRVERFLNKYKKK